MPLSSEMACSVLSIYVSADLTIPTRRIANAQLDLSGGNGSIKIQLRSMIGRSQHASIQPAALHEIVSGNDTRRYRPPIATNFGPCGR